MTGIGDTVCAHLRVALAGNVADEDLARTQFMACSAVRRREGAPLTPDPSPRLSRVGHIAEHALTLNLSSDTLARTASVSAATASVEGMHYYEPTGETCPECKRPISWQVVREGTMGGEPIEARSGPSCWAAWCSRNN